MKALQSSWLVFRHKNEIWIEINGIGCKLKFQVQNPLCFAACAPTYTHMLEHVSMPRAREHWHVRRIGVTWRHVAIIMAMLYRGLEKCSDSFQAKFSEDCLRTTFKNLNMADCACKQYLQLIGQLATTTTQWHISNPRLVSPPMHNILGHTYTHNTLLRSVYCYVAYP